jgi:16S rRNA G527 N7-methylase RsmG
MMKKLKFFRDLKKKVDESAMELVKKKAESYSNVTKDAVL